MFRVLLFSSILFLLPVSAFAQQQVTDRQRSLENQLNAIEAQIAEQQKLLDVAQTQQKSLQREIDIFTAEIRKTELQIQAITVTIHRLSGDIGADNALLESLSAKLSREKAALIEIMRQTQALDRYSVVEVALSSKDVSSFFTDLDAFVSIREAFAASFTEIATLSEETAAAKAKLEDKLSEQQELETEARLAKKQVQAQEKEKKQLLIATKGQEAAYQKLITTNKKTAAQIRAELFTLRDSAAIPFGLALAYAQTAERATGVRAAVTLGVLKQETNLGENLGSGHWRTDMHPTRDQPVFPYITSALGLDPEKMPVSKKPSYGWGGAMGPGQFIPSTWVCYGGLVHATAGRCTPGGMGTAFWAGPWRYDASKDRVRKLSGGSDPSNPWSPEDAIMATAMLMGDNGASTQRYADERYAALRYFAGVNASKKAYAFYGDGVMKFATQFQSQIDILGGA